MVDCHMPLPSNLWLRAYNASEVPLDTASGTPLDPITEKEIKYSAPKNGPDGEAWLNATANDIDRLAQGVHPNIPVGAYTIFFIHRKKNTQQKTNVPKNCPYSTALQRRNKTHSLVLQWRQNSLS